MSIGADDPRTGWAGPDPPAATGPGSPVDPDREAALVAEALGLAVRAPSIHNSQPWEFRVRPGMIDLYADLDRWLPRTDADGRDLMLSCGAVLHHLRVALTGVGLAAAVHRLPDPDDPDWMARIRLGAGHPDPRDLTSVILSRRSDRRPFQTRVVATDLLVELASAAAGQASVLTVVTDPGHLRLLRLAIREAAAVQRDLPGLGEELRRWTLDRSDSDGVPAGNVPRGSRWDARFPHGSSATTTPEPPGEDGAVVMIVSTGSDQPMAQLRAGEGLSAVLLRATQLGLASCPLTQPLEVTGTRQAVQDGVLGGTSCPQVILRVGWAGGQEPLPPTPRRLRGRPDPAPVT